MTELQKKLIEGWSKEEKFNLLRAMREFGSRDIEKIQSLITSKTCKEIAKAIEYYRAKAFINPQVLRKREQRKINICATPLGRWAKALTDTKSYDELKTDIATALRLIADFEERSPKACTEQYNFGKAYHTLANALDGRILPDDPKENTLLEKCLIDTANASKTLKTFSVQDVISDIVISADWVDDNIIIHKANENAELANIRCILNQREYNPLQLSENHLKIDLN